MLGLAATAGMLLVSTSKPTEASSYRYLCTSVPSACEYTGPDAPVLRADVCWNGSVALLKGTAPCATSSWAYYVDYGSVDPLTGEVAPYVPLDDACDLGYCEVLQPNETLPEDEGEICCPEGVNTEACTLDPDCNDVMVYCHNYETNGDGTVNCKDPSS